LIEHALQKDLAWLQKDLRALAGFEPQLAGWCSLEELQASAFIHLRGWLLPKDPLPQLSEQHFRSALDTARQRLPGLSSQLMDRLQKIFAIRQDILRRVQPVPRAKPARTLMSFQQLETTPAKPVLVSPIERDLNTLMPNTFLQALPFERLGDFVRYLKALRVRAERALVNPAKDQARSQLVLPYVEALNRLVSRQPKERATQEALEEFRWMVEEYKVSVFAQEIGTAIPVSPERLNEQLARLRTRVP
jgi:ATP-dependent helicase HrpA